MITLMLGAKVMGPKRSMSFWDYKKVFYKLRMKDGTIMWAWPNCGRLFNSEMKISKKYISIEDVDEYMEADDEYFETQIKLGK